MLIPYFRQSRKREHTISIEEQRRDVQAWAERNGVRLGAEVIEQGVSGSTPWRERSLGAVVSACERGEAEGVVVAYQSRLSREHGLATAEVWEALRQAGARLVCVAENIDTSTGDHELLFSIQAAIARDQWKKFRDSGERARRSAIEREVHVGPVPAGYVRRAKGGKLEAGEHAAAIRRAFEARAAGASWTEVARLLTEAGVPTRKGGAWSLKATAKLLSNPAYLGVVRSGDFRKDEAHEALVSRRLFERVQRRRETRTRHSDKEPGLLSGLLVCGGCGHRLVQDFVARNGTRTPFYRCRNGGACEARASITHRRIEPYVERLALEYLGAVEFGREARSVPPEVARAVEAARDDLASFVEYTPAHLPGYVEGIARREAALREAEEALDAAAEETEGWSTLLSAEYTVELYERMTLAHKRVVLGALVREARVRRGSGPVEQRVAVEFRPLPPPLPAPSGETPMPPYPSPEELEAAETVRA